MTYNTQHRTRTVRFSSWGLVTKWSLIICITIALVYLMPALLNTSTNDLPSLGAPWRLKMSLIHEKVPTLHVYYLKNHKTASTTVFSILAEYCRANELTPLLPVGAHINQRPPLHPKQLRLDPKIQFYDMVYHHHVYSDQIFRFLHNDTFKFTTLREPFRHFVSSFTYFRKFNMNYLTQINSTTPLKTFLENPKKYETRGYSSYTNNRQSMDLGYNLSHPFDDTSYIAYFIQQTEKRFDLILITEYFNESLVLLKRKLNWKTGDILYYKKQECKESTEAVALATQLEKEQHKSFSTADIGLYTYFLGVFKGLVSKEVDLQGEVEEFQAVLEKVYDFCDRVDSPDSRLVVPVGRWSDQVDLFHSKCKWLKLDEIRFTQHFQRKQIRG
ncbi:unnamed protein product [Lymnaea stagnalis]|uniref:Uncharacterized protein n=1 Tax=Lymnaea stagnalis TaxID=6523 RepID=A0AAV2HPC9_LYMST